MVSLSRPYPFNFFKVCLPQNLLSPLSNILSQIILALLQGLQLFTDVKSGVTDLAVFFNSDYWITEQIYNFQSGRLPKGELAKSLILWVVQIKR